MLPTEFQVNWPLGSWRSQKYIFKMAIKMATTTAILDFLSEQIWLILIYKSPQCFLLSFKSIGLLVQEKEGKTDFQDGHHGGHLGFPIGSILAIFDLSMVNKYSSANCLEMAVFPEWGYNFTTCINIQARSYIILQLAFSRHDKRDPTCISKCIFMTR